MKRILFLCTGNSCRSQMAEGYMRHMAEQSFEAFSAGVDPTAVNPLSIKVMEETGVDISEYRSKSVEEFSDQRFDIIVTVCGGAKQNCPVFPGEHKKIHWDLDDPADAQGTEDEKLLVFRKIRNRIKENVLDLLDLPRDKANLKCPFCGDIRETDIPANSCLISHKCGQCHKVSTPTEGSCCVICAYSDKNCPVFCSC